MRRFLLSAAILAAAACAAPPAADDAADGCCRGVGATADRAKAEMMKAVHAHLCEIGRDYLASLAAGEPERAESDRCPSLFPSYRPEASSGASVLAEELREAAVIDGVWKDPADGSTKARARISRAKVDDILIRNLGDVPKLQEFIRSRR